MHGFLPESYTHMTGTPVLLDVVPPSSFEPLAVQYRTFQAEASNTLVRQV